MDRPGTAAGPARERPGRRTLVLIVTPLIGFVIAAQVGDALAPQLVDRHPLLLIALNARNRNLVLTTNLLDPVPYYVVGTLRLLASDPLFYLLGYFYGESAVDWISRKSRLAHTIVESWSTLFHKARYPLVFLAPNNFICFFAGAVGMRPGVFLPLNLAGTIGRLWLIRALGETFEAPIDDLLGFIKDYRLPLTVLAVAIVLGSIWRDRRGGETEVETLAHLPDELAPEEGDTHPD